MPLCKSCGQTEIETEFYSGIATYCKEHWKERTKNNRLKKLDYYLEYDRERGSDPSRVAMRKAYYQTAQGKAAANKAKRTHVGRNPIKRKASNMVTNAVRGGKIKKESSCENCASTGRLNGHHDDYAKPLDVRWLCSKCHKDWHSKNGPGKNGDNPPVILSFVTKSGSVACLGRFNRIDPGDLRKYVRKNDLAWISA